MAEEYSIKEYISSKIDDMKESVKELHDELKEVHTTAKQGLEQATKTNGRVNRLEEAFVQLSDLVKKQESSLNEQSKTIHSHDEMLLSTDVTSKITEKRNKLQWSIVKWSLPFVVSFLGYFGYLYMEHVQKQLVADTSVAVVQSLSDKYNIKINGN